MCTHDDDGPGDQYGVRGGQGRSAGEVLNLANVIGIFAIAALMLLAFAAGASVAM